MAVLRYLAYLFALVGLLATGLLVFRIFIADSRTHFATYDELAASGLIGRGWVPPALPRSAKNISESHDVSSNSSAGTFTFNPQDTSLADSTCKLLARSSEGGKFVCPPFEQQLFILILKADGSGHYESRGNEI